MSHLVVGDGHYYGAEGEADRWGALMQAASDAGVAELSILGDFFELWIGLPGLTTPWQEALFAPIRRLRQAGVRVRYVVGNKDYYVAEFNRRHGLFDEVVEISCELPSPQGSLHLAHGDLVNAADRQYRTWRWFSRSLLIRWIGRALPRSWLRRLSARIARRLESTNTYHKSYFPEAQLRARAREMPPGELTLIYGHFHAHHELTEGDKRIITLPFLATENAGVLITDEGIERFSA